jgi:CheY-like chemotaxis protein/anti-sigma regulatory factor (Ser/Thr protein kinase)
LKEVITNVLFNAVEAMPGGGQITLSTHSRGHWVEVIASDTGTGMSEDVRKRVFDPFFTTKGVTNSGLGMSVSFGIIKRHGGEILVESEPGRGTTFILHLPMGSSEEERPGEGSAPKAERFARVLVIDDEASVRDILSRMLKIKGHDVVLASSGEEGLERLKSEHFDLVLTDLGMSKITGWEVGKAAKDMDPRIPVGMITGWGTEVSRETMSENGIDFVVSKPFHFDQVIASVSDALEQEERK